MDDSSEKIQWLEKYIYNKQKHIEIVTIDNPGWGVSADLNNHELKVEKRVLVDFEETENNWYCCWTENKKFEAAGGPFNLSNILSVLKQFTNSEDIKETVFQFPNPNDPFTWLQNWYFSQCDEDWEHCYGVVIQTNENGWRVKVDLIETESEDLIQELKTLHQSENNWVTYSIEKSIFEAFCSPLNLLAVINLFKDLIESNESDC